MEGGQRVYKNLPETDLADAGRERNRRNEYMGAMSHFN